MLFDSDTEQLSFLTTQWQQLGTVEVQHSPQGRAVSAVLQQVVHGGDPGDQLGGCLLLPVAGLRFIGTHGYKPKFTLHRRAVATILYLQGNAH